MVASGKEVLGSILYCLSLNHKQMSMYYAPAFFAHLLGRCLRRPTLLTQVIIHHCLNASQAMHLLPGIFDMKFTPRCPTKCLQILGYPVMSCIQKSRYV